MTDLKPEKETKGFDELKEALSISGLVPSGPDSVENFEEERLHRKQRLAAGLRILGRLRLAEGVAGHVTVRDPEYPHRFWVNPFGKNFKLMKVSALLCVDQNLSLIHI